MRTKDKLFYGIVVLATWAVFAVAMPKLLQVTHNLQPWLADWRLTASQVCVLLMLATVAVTAVGITGVYFRACVKYPASE